jgi:CHAT domain-containing protein
MIRLKRLKADIYSSTANYEQAKNVLKDGMALAEATKDTFNLLLCLNGFGLLFEKLQEYDLALDYYHQAQFLFGTSDQNMSARLTILNNIVDVATAMQDSVLFEVVNREAKKLVNFADMPWQKAELLRNLGNMYKKIKKYSVAIPYFQEAASIYNRNGFLRLDLGTRIDLSDCLIGLSQFGKARNLLTEIELLARKINYDERVIDALGRRAKIEYREGNITRAMERSQTLLSAIAAQSKQIKSPDFLISYHQKLYDLQKETVIYGLILQGQDSAFARLANIKAYALQNQLTKHQDNTDNSPTLQQRLDFNLIRTNLKKKSLLIDYMVTDDTLYAFVLKPDGLKLFRKKIGIETLRKTVSAYKDSISRTIQVFQHYDAHQVDAHYISTVALAEKLYDDLFGWPELELLLKQANLLFVIPDEFLYEVPFSTLVAKSPQAQSFVANHLAVLTLPNASFLQSSNDVRSSDLNTKRVLISADQRFPGAEKFIAKVKALFPLAEELSVNNSVLMQNDVLAKLQADYQIYIFVGHGAANPKYPDRGYIDLSVKTPNLPVPQITRLTVADLRGINWLGAEMVILVGCETASGKLYRGTGISGLQQEFLLLGAQNVLGNLWEVVASRAIPQAENFLTFWAATLNVAQALQACQSNAIQELQESNYFKHPHPYFWGSYIISTINIQQ